jgi:hypothetical protein
LSLPFDAGPGIHGIPPRATVQYWSILSLAIVFSLGATKCKP